MAEKRERISTISPVRPVLQLADIAKVEAEKAVLASVFHHPDLFPVLNDLLQPSDFFTLFHGYVWYAFEQLSGRNEGLDFLTVGNELDKRGLNDAARLVELTTAAPDISNAENYAQIVRDASLRVRIINAAIRISSYVMDNPQAATEQIIDESNRLLFEATEQRADSGSSLIEVASSEMSRIEAILHGELPEGIPTGFHNLNALLHVYAPGELVVLAGAEGMGKTTMLLSKIRNELKIGKNILMFTLEMSKAEIVRILAAMESGIPKDVLKVGTLSQGEWGRYVKAMGDISRWPLFIVDEYPTLSPLQLQRRLRKLETTEAIKFDLVVSDGLWLMEANEPSEQRFRDVAVITRDLITIGRRFNVPVLVTHQYNAEAHKRNDKKPSVYDVAESAAVRRNAQIILGLYRDVFYGIETLQDVTQLFILKDRNGTAQGKTVDYLFNRGFNRYEEVNRG